MSNVIPLLLTEIIETMTHTHTHTHCVQGIYAISVRLRQISSLTVIPKYQNDSTFWRLFVFKQSQEQRARTLPSESLRVNRGGAIPGTQ